MPGAARAFLWRCEFEFLSVGISLCSETHRNAQRHEFAAAPGLVLEEEHQARVCGHGLVHAAAAGHDSGRLRTGARLKRRGLAPKAHAQQAQQAPPSRLASADDHAAVAAQAGRLDVPPGLFRVQEGEPAGHKALEEDTSHASSTARSTTTADAPAEPRGNSSKRQNPTELFLRSESCDGVGEESPRESRPFAERAGSEPKTPDRPTQLRSAKKFGSAEPGAFFGSSRDASDFGGGGTSSVKRGERGSFARTSGRFSSSDRMNGSSLRTKGARRQHLDSVNGISNPELQTPHEEKVLQGVSMRKSGRLGSSTSALPSDDTAVRPLASPPLRERQRVRKAFGKIRGVSDLGPDSAAAVGEFTSFDSIPGFQSQGNASTEYASQGGLQQPSLHKESSALGASKFSFRKFASSPRQRQPSFQSTESSFVPPNSRRGTQSPRLDNGRPAVEFDPRRASSGSLTSGRFKKYFEVYGNTRGNRTRLSVQERLQMWDAEMQNFEHSSAPEIVLVERNYVSEEPLGTSWNARDFDDRLETSQALQRPTFDSANDLDMLAVNRAATRNLLSASRHHSLRRSSADHADSSLNELGTYGRSISTTSSSSGVRVSFRHSVKITEFDKDESGLSVLGNEEGYIDADNPERAYVLAKEVPSSCTSSTASANLLV
ncbi:hypothetical protein FVE85_1088 [Porphyridium purpureum]|uniref:Uncharacterized protein n=1 Tax=Porphyridium purpureum TaxID=35688 RepID=A0A5J4Z0H9_PORPP|nr:hypothetical protein FVE85_1088 [Porphyridium purpureum]|eukprot:POR8086..scf208_2